MRLFSFVVLSLITFSAHAKKNVCTITINSDNEKKVMQRHLPAADFEFTELLPSEKKAGKDDDEENGVPKWLNDACEKKIECDMLVISGHFGGTFFGTSGYNLSLEQIERAACRPECAGVFKKPKETFLFGCNTLAGKKPDHRTPEQYLQVLIEDGIDRSMAEQAVALRYSPWGNQNLDRMTGVFSNSAKIYGFDSVGPSGKKIENMLGRYFSAKGKGYSAYLDRLTKQTPVNSSLRDALKTTTHVEATGMEHSSSPAICYLNDKKVPRISKIRFVERSLVSDNPLLYAPAIAHWVSEMKDNDLIEEEWEMLDRITWSRDTKERFVKMADQLKNLPMIEASIWNFALNMRWITEKQFDQKLRDAILPFFKDKVITRAERDAVCGIAHTNEKFRISVSKHDLGIQTLSSDMVTALVCLGNTDRELITHAEAGLQARAKADRENAVMSLFVMALVSKVRDFSHRAVVSARQSETEDELKTLLLLLEGYAEGGLDLAAYWHQKIEEFRMVNLEDQTAAANWMMGLYFRKLSPAIINVMLERLGTVDPLNGGLYAYAYILAVLKQSADPEELADAVLARQSTDRLVSNFGAFFNDPENAEEKAKALRFWRKVHGAATNETLKSYAEANINTVNSLRVN